MYKTKWFKYIVIGGLSLLIPFLTSFVFAKTDTKDLAEKVLSLNCSAGASKCGVQPWTISGSDIYYDKGNVGIGTPYGPQSTLQVSTTSGAMWGGFYNAVTEMNVNPTTPTYANYTNIYSRLNTNGSGDIMGNNRNIDATLINSNSNSVADLEGIFSQVIHSGSGTIYNAFANRGIVVNSGSGTVSDARALNAEIQNQSNGTMSNVYGLYVWAAQNYHGDITHAVGAFLADQTVGSGSNADLTIGSNPISGNFAIYNSSSYPSYFNGYVGIGTAYPSTKLDVLDGMMRATQASTQTCDASVEGGFYYNKADKHFWGCDGTNWKQLDN